MQTGSLGSAAAFASDPFRNLALPQSVQPAQVPALSPPGLQPTPDFATLFTQAIGDLNQTQSEANVAVEQVLLGNPDVSSTEALTAVKKADLALRTILQVRNKLLEAYQSLEQMRF